MPLHANLYCNQVNLSRYTAGETCSLCRAASLEELMARIKQGEIPGGACAHWPPAKVAAFRLALEAGAWLPEIPVLEFPRPTAPGLVELNYPGPGSPVLVSGNSEFTQAVLLAVISRTVSPLRLLLVDTLGHTVDMALIFQALTAEKIVVALKQADLISPAQPRIILPGLAQGLVADLEDRLGRAVEIGPVCAAELPLYLGEAWIPAG